MLQKTKSLNKRENTDGENITEEQEQMNSSMNNQQDAMAACAGWRCWGGLKQPAAKAEKH